MQLKRGVAMDAVKTGIVDVAMSGEPISTLRTESKEAKVVWRSPDIIPHWMEQGLASTEDFARDHGEIVRGFLMAHIKGLDYMRDNAAEAGRIWARMVGFKDVELAARANAKCPKTAWSVKISVEALNEIEKCMVALKQIDKPIDWKALIDQSFLPLNLRVPLPS
jgi:ABC-type nitrate/sulfonate/bicarbonate transport system substrate-binding protein